MTNASHFEILVEEPSMEAFLAGLLPRVLGQDVSFRIRTFQRKADLLKKLPERLRAYKKWLPADHCVLVIVDRDNEDCKVLKARLEQCFAMSGLQTKMSSPTPRTWQGLTRIAIEELEAWYFGDWDAVRSVYPRVSASVLRSQRYREPDGILGGTWEAFERILQRGGYYKSGISKIELARNLGTIIDPARNRSPSFNAFIAAILEAKAPQMHGCT